ncbi:insulinase family protein [Endozoicomonas arenosclerae]|uniref:insulinase family protein n=1 Tax=Endozoicomonas arenosclerae TaxID=1633495 RepID=UPI000A6FEF69|nr:insulinase family protein [Endozoicomonas arenosclerae]
MRRIRKGDWSTLLKTSFFAIPILLSTGCAPLTDNTETRSAAVTAETIIKSVNDQREYQYLTLENGVRTLLISDPDTDKAAVSIDVNVGSWSDPEGREGLVHFLEHMLFLKSEKYPELDGYREFIRSRGGTNNATTYAQSTNYYFEINADDLQPALDRLAYSVSQPILDKQYVDRERNAVDSEFRLNFKNDGWRKYITEGMISKSDHPYAAFSTGNLDTLNNDDGKSLLDDLKALHREFYVGSNMAVVVYGKEPLSTLQSWANASLSSIAAGKRSVNAYKEPFRKDQQGVRINIETLADTYELKLVFSLPSTLDDYKVKPLDYISQLIGGEGPGSLHSVLKEKGLIENLYSYSWDYAGAFSELEVVLSLTESGYKQLESVTEATFSYLELLQKEGVKETLYQQTANLASIDFRFKEQSRPVDYAMSVAKRLQNYPSSHVLFLPYSYESYEPELIQGYLDQLTADRVRLVVSAKDVEVDQVEPFYLTRYGVKPLSEAFLKRLESPETISGLSVPTANPYIPEDFAVLSAAETQQEVPSLVIDQPGLRLWHLQDQTYQQPKSDLKVILSTTVVSQTASDMVKSWLLNRLYLKALNERIYQASEAGMDFSIQPTSSGLELSLSGYHDKQPELLYSALETVQSVDFNEKSFKSVKDALRLILKNQSLNTPDDQAYYAMWNLVNVGRFSSEESLQYLEPVTLEDLKAYRRKVFEQAHLDLLVHGNVSKQQALEYSEKVKSLVKQPAQPYRSSIYDLKAVDTLNLQLDIEHTDSVSVLYYQAKDESVQSRAMYALLGEMLGSDFFRELRTNQQLGYVVWGGANRIKDRPGLAFVIQSPNTNPDELKRRMLAFFDDQQKEIQTIKEETLETYKQGLMDDLLKKDLSLSKRTSRFWRYISSDEIDFNETVKFAEAIGKISREELIRAYDTALLSTDALSIEIKSYGTRHQDKKEESEESTACIGLSCIDMTGVPKT